MNEPTVFLQLFAEEAAAPAGEAEQKAALYDAYAPSLEALAKKYGIEAGPAALENALHQEAQADLAQRQAQADRLYSAWMDQAEQTKQAYPGFDLAAELQDQRFLGMLKAQVDVRTAYEALHRQEAQAAVAQAAEERLLGLLAQERFRPQENGTAAQAPSVTRQDVSRMSKADRQAIIARVQRGEKVTF